MPKHWLKLRQSYQLVRIDGGEACLRFAILVAH